MMAAVDGMGASGVTVDLVAADARLADQIVYGLCTHKRSTFAFFLQYAALFDSDAGHYPFIVRVDHGAELFVGQPIVGQIGTCCCDYGI